MERSRSNSTLRLVTGDGASARPAWPRRNTATAAEQVRRANTASAAISPFDARWILAVRVSGELQGGRAAVLSPDARRRLIQSASGLGLRPFDANLVIAIVQDGARSGEGSLGSGVGGRLTLIPAGSTKRAREAELRRALVVAVLLGAAIAFMIAGWIAS